jgi:hypothetical protein
VLRKRSHQYSRRVPFVVEVGPRWCHSQCFVAGCMVELRVTLTYTRGDKEVRVPSSENEILLRMNEW